MMTEFNIWEFMGSKILSTVRYFFWWDMKGWRAGEGSVVLQVFWP